MKRTVLMVAGLVALVVAGPAEARAPGASVTVSMTEFKYALSKASVKRGVVAFRVVNRGAIAHDFKILGRRTPVYASGRGGVLRVTFRKPGRYPYICTLPGHAAAGMRGVLRVT